MSLIISDTGAVRLPDALGNSGWVTTVKPSGQQEGQVPAAGEKIQDSQLPPPNFDRLDLSKAISLDDKMVPGGELSAQRRFDTYTPGTEAAEADISQMFYEDGSASLALPEDAAQQNADIWEGQTKEIVIELSPEGKRYQAMTQMIDEENAFIEQMKADISAGRMDYFESQRFVKESFTALYTDWMHNKPEFFKILFDRNEDHFANHEWDMIAKPEGWTDADFDFWKNYDPWGLE